MSLTLDKVDLQTFDFFCPYININEGPLSDNNSRFYHVSCDEKDLWVNGIFQNSRFGIFHLYEENNKFKLELIAKGLETIKFRKCTVKSEAEALLRIKTWTRLVRGLTP